MTLQLINTGTTANDGTGDSIRTMAQKVNEIISFLNGNYPTRFLNANSDTSVDANQMVFVDTSGGTVTLNFPDVTSLGDIAIGTYIDVLDVKRTFDVNNLTITTADASLIDGNNSVVIDGTDIRTGTSPQISYRFIYTGSVNGWRSS